MEICPKCLRMLRSATAWHYCEKRNYEELFENKSEILLFLFEEILDVVGKWEKVYYSTTKSCVVFTLSSAFLIVKPMKKELDLKFFLPDFTDEPPIRTCLEYGAKYQANIRLADTEDLTQRVFRLIKMSYDMKS